MTPGPSHSSTPDVKPRPPIPLDTRLSWYLFVFALAVRLCTLPMVETGGDAVGYWLFVKQAILTEVPLAEQWDHRTVRFGLTGVSYVLSRIFGTHAVCYYAAPLLMSALSTVLIFQVGRRITSRRVSFWTAVALVLYPPMVQSGGQLMPAVFSMTYVLGCTWCLLRSALSTARSAWWAVGSGLCLFLAYLSKLPNLQFVPGLLLAAWLLRLKWRTVAAAGGGFVVPVVVENAIHHRVYGRPLGRLSYVLDNHLEAHQEPLSSVFGLLERFSSLDGASELLLYSYLVAASTTLIWRSRIRRPLLAVSMLPLSFLVLTLLGIKSWDPLLPVQPFRDRYLVVACPFMLLLVTHWTAEMLRPRIRCGVLNGPAPLPRAWGAPYIKRLLPTALLAALVLPEVGWDQHPLVLLPRYRQEVLQAWKEQTPIVSRSYRGKPLHVTSALFWNPTDFHGLRQPPTVRRMGRTYYLQNPSAPPIGSSRRAQQAALAQWEQSEQLNAFAIQNVLLGKWKLDLFRLERNTYGGSTGRALR